MHTPYCAAAVDNPTIAVRFLHVSYFEACSNVFIVRQMSTNLKLGGKVGAAAQPADRDGAGVDVEPGQGDRFGGRRDRAPRRHDTRQLDVDALTQARHHPEGEWVVVKGAQVLTIEWVESLRRTRALKEDGDAMRTAEGKRARPKELATPAVIAGGVAA